MKYKKYNWKDGAGNLYFGDDELYVLENQHYICFYKAGKLHNTAGYAVIYKNSDKKIFYLEAKEYTTKEYIDELYERNIIDKDEALVIYLTWI
jgi:hypothetical protein